MEHVPKGTSERHDEQQRDAQLAASNRVTSRLLQKSG